MSVTALIATSVVRGSRQGESHGGVFLVDLANQRARQVLDWNTLDIDWQGRGWDRGLRGIAFDGNRVYIAASDELFVYNPKFELLESYRNPHLKHCHEIAVYKRRLYLTSTGFDSILGFDLDKKQFSWGLHISQAKKGFKTTTFLPGSNHGPDPMNTLHLNNVYCIRQGLFTSGRNSGGLLHWDGKQISEALSLPPGSHNARPYRDGVLFNDSDSDVVRFKADSGDRVFDIPKYEDSELTHTDLDDSRIARQGFGRGLCLISDTIFAAGSSPSTITIHDIENMKTVLSINLSMDVRNAIHGLEVWPYPIDE